MGGPKGARASAIRANQARESPTRLIEGAPARPTPPPCAHTRCTIGGGGAAPGRPGLVRGAHLPALLGGRGLLAMSKPTKTSARAKRAWESQAQAVRLPSRAIPRLAALARTLPVDSLCRPSGRSVRRASPNALEITPAAQIPTSTSKLRPQLSRSLWYRYLGRWLLNFRLRMRTARRNNWRRVWVWRGKMTPLACVACRRPRPPLFLSRTHLLRSQAESAAVISVVKLMFCCLYARRPIYFHWENMNVELTQFFFKLLWLLCAKNVTHICVYINTILNI